MTIPGRKADHVRIALTDESAFRSGPGFDEVELAHCALPEVDFERIDTGTELLGRRLAMPLVISAMTGGHPDGGRINATLARAAARHSIAMGVGSQRAALHDPSLADTYAVARREAPDALLLANVGAAQLVTQGSTPPLTPDDVGRLAGMIQADAVVVHLNAIQELVMPEGDRNGAGWSAAIGRLVRELALPVVAKETGGGMTGTIARRLADLGVAAIDVGGRGGTSFAAVEGVRARERGDPRGPALAALLADWGIPTAASVRVAARTGIPVIATGGVRSGLDAARALALGATAVGVARPLLEAALSGDTAVDAWLERFADGLRGTMFLTGASETSALRAVPLVLSGATERWAQALDAADAADRSERPAGARITEERS